MGAALLLKWDMSHFNWDVSHFIMWGRVLNLSHEMGRDIFSLYSAPCPISPPLENQRSGGARSNSWPAPVGKDPL